MRQLAAEARRERAEKERGWAEAAADALRDRELKKVYIYVIIYIFIQIDRLIDRKKDR